MVPAATRQHTRRTVAPTQAQLHQQSHRLQGRGNLLLELRAYQERHHKCETINNIDVEIHSKKDFSVLSQVQKHGMRREGCHA
jgi:hypothetical protein